MKIDHVQLAMPEGGEEVARGFFGGVLGMAERGKPEALATRGGCWFELKGCGLHMGVDPAFTPQHKAHPAFLVTDLRELAHRLESAGFDVRWDTSVKDLERFYTDDPFGNRLEFIRDGSGFSQRAYE